MPMMQSSVSLNLPLNLYCSPVEIIVAQGLAVPVISKLALPVPVVYVFSEDPVSAGSRIACPTTWQYDRHYIHGRRTC
jgi:hypothetical protein